MKITNLIFIISFLATTSASLNAQADHRILQEGDRFYDLGNYQQAAAVYRKGQSGIARYNAGNAVFRQGRYAEAIGLYREAVDKSTSFSARADALYNLGNAYLLQGQYREAIEVYESSLRLWPNRPDAKKNLKIARKKLQEPPPETPPPPPPPPPPPSNIPPQKNYLDQPQQPGKPEAPPANLPRETALRLLEEAILPEEQKNARTYRELSPATRPSRVKKDW